MPEPNYTTLSVGVIGGGLAGLTAGLALRRAGHKVTIYERYHYAGEVGASLSCASNGGKLLTELGVPMLETRPVILRKLIKRKWIDGEVTDIYDLGDYEAKYGAPYYNLHRIDIHSLLLKCATDNEGEGSPCVLKVDHQSKKVNHQTGEIEFENGFKIKHDLVVAADGIRSKTRDDIGLVPNFKPSSSCCYRCLFDTKTVLEKGLKDFSNDDAIEYWWTDKPDDDGIDKIVLSACKDRKVVSCYCFYPSYKNEIKEGGWNDDASVKMLLDTFSDLDNNIKELFKIAYDIKQWRLYVYQPFDYWKKGKVVQIGDSIHPMMPDQSLGAVMAFEDAFVLGYVLRKDSGLTLDQALEVYEKVRKPRATRVQSASLRARENLTERIGFSSKLNNDPDKLTIDEICGYDIKEDIKKVIEELYN